LDKDADELVSQYFIPNIQEVMRKGTIMCTLNHILFYKSMVENGDKIALILEDDPFFDRHFVDKLGAIVKEAKTLPKGFFISLENSTLEFPSCRIVKKEKYLYEADHGRCAGAYLLDQSAAKNILERLQTKKCETVIDHWHNILIQEDVFKMYWAHPTIVEQGSLNGKMSSVNSTRAQSLIRRLEWLSQKYYKTFILRYLK
jgi:glycosyl transferase family 25